MNNASTSSKSGSLTGIWWLILLQAVFFAPILTTGLLQDDRVLAVLDFGKPDTFSVIATSTGRWIAEWLEIGRFLPVAPILSTPLFHFFDFNHPFGYHLLQLLLIICCGTYFAVRFVPAGLPRIAAVLLVCMMSANYPVYHDPYLSYHLVMPLITLCFFGAAAWFGRHLETGMAWQGVVALGLYLLTLLTYEIAYPLILVFIVQLLWLRPRRLQTWLSLLLLGTTMAGFQIWLRMQAKQFAYEGNSMNLELWTVIRTFVIQAFSSIPFAQQFGGLLGRITGSSSAGPVDSLLVLGGLATLIALVTWLGVRFLKLRTRENALLVIGLIVWLAPALVISISAKYQTELRWGVGYIPRFLQNFGLALATIGLAGRWLGSRAGIAALSALVLMVFALNVRTIRSLNRESAAARLLFNVVADRGFVNASGCRNLFVTERFVHSFDQYEALNPDIKVHGGDQPANGDHVLLVHHGNPGSEWAVFGAYDHGQVRAPRLLLGKRHPDRKAATTHVGDWAVTPIAAPEMDFQQLLAAVATGSTPPPQSSATVQ